MRSIFKQSLTRLNSEFSYSSYLTKTKVPSLLDYLLIAGERTDEYMLFTRVF